MAANCRLRTQMGHTKLETAVGVEKARGPLSRIEIQTMELYRLRYFTTLAETLSFTRAAESLFVSQSTLSQQIASLEHELGVKLFNRTKRSVSLTDSGYAMLPASYKILQQVDQLPSITNEAASADEHENALRIGMDCRIMYCTALKSTLTEYLFHLHEAIPNLYVAFSTNEYDELSRDLKDGNVDVGFLLHQEPTASRNDDLATACLFEDEMVVVVRTKQHLPDTPETISELVQRDGVTLLGREGRGIMQTTHLFDDLGITPAIRLVPTRDVMLLTLGSGERPSILPQSLLNELPVSDIKVLHFRSPNARLYGLATWSTRHDNNRLIDLLVTAAHNAFDTSVKNFGSDSTP